MKLGLIARTAAGKGVGACFERAVLGRFPGYDLIKSISTRFSGLSDDERFAPALVTLVGESQSPAIIVEEHDELHTFRAYLADTWRGVDVHRPQ